MLNFPPLLGILRKKMHACPIPSPPAHVVYVLLMGKELSLHIKQEPETMLSTVSLQWCMC